MFFKDEDQRVSDQRFYHLFNVSSFFFDDYRTLSILITLPADHRKENARIESFLNKISTWKEDEFLTVV